jgi:general stress protein 26
MGRTMAEGAERAWQLMQKIGFCMLTTRDGEVLRSRPMAAHVQPEEGMVYFLTDARQHKDDEISEDPAVCLAFADTSGQKYVSVSGHAKVLDDRSKVHELWSTPAKAWWQNKDDPNIRILSVAPEDAEYWDSPGTAVSYIKMAAAAVTGTKPNMGKNEKVSL